jgi:ABC-type sugar transport system substrate-binding protein
VIISVGHWPVLNPSAYRQSVLPYKSKLQGGQLSIIVGVGRVLPAQAELLKQKLVSAFVSIDFFKMGQQAYLVMKAAAEGKPYSAVNETPNQVRLAK